MSTSLKTFVGIIISAVLLGGATIVYQYTKTEMPIREPKNVRSVSDFVKYQKHIYTEMCRKKGIQPNAEALSLFAQAETNNWSGIVQTFQKISPLDQRPQDLKNSTFQPVLEVYGMLECLHSGDAGLMDEYLQKILTDSLTSNALYFGGTDPGRFMLTYGERSGKVNGLVVLTQNALVDSTYIDYLPYLYAREIVLPNARDVEDIFRQTVAEYKTGQKKGEGITFAPDGQVHFTGITAIFEINGEVVKKIWKENKNKRDIYIEESYPIEWMYPYLTPAGLIMKLNPEPVKNFEKSLIEEDMDYWEEVIGSLRKDPRFIKSIYAQRMYGKLRASIAGLYDKRGMIPEARRAYEQALQLCPMEAEIVTRTVNFFLDNDLKDEAKNVVSNAIKEAAGSQAWQEAHPECLKTLENLNQKLQNDTP